MKKFSRPFFFSILSLSMLQLASAPEATASDILRSDQVRKVYTDDVLKKRNDTPALDAHQCSTLLQKQANDHHRYQSGVGKDGKSITPADIDQLYILGKHTRLTLQPNPAQTNKNTTTKTTNTATSGNTTTTTEQVTTKSDNRYGVASASPIDVVIDHASGLVIINGSVSNSFDLRQLQESCEAARH